jgi:RNA polymerase sigma-70 factor (ECF subfamily)
MAATQTMNGTVASPATDVADEQRVVSALRLGDESAFMELVEQYHATMIRVARAYVADAEVAEEVVQEAWLGLLQSLPRFEGRCSLKTWIFRILTNRAQTRGERERRGIAFSKLERLDGDDRPSVDPDRFAQNGHWSSAPQSWDDIPDERILATETREHIRAAIEMLPDRQKAVITLRDVEGWPAEEVCELLGINATHQRVLLHRARSAVRMALEKYLGDVGPVRAATPA